MPQPIEMGPQPELSMLTTQKAMKVVYRHTHFVTDAEPEEYTVYYPINGGIWLKMVPMCADCDIELLLESHEIVEVR